MIETIIVVTRRTALQDLVLKMNTIGQARFYLEQNGVNFEEYYQADARYQQALAAVLRQIPPQLKLQQIDRDLLPTYQFGPHDLVITVGPDGLVVNVAKYLASQPILAVNPDPARIDGVLCRCQVGQVGALIDQVIAGSAVITSARMAQAQLNDGQQLLALNDLFIGMRSHVSARYQIAHGKRSEQQISSGIIVATGAGSTGWIRSIVAGATQVVRHFVDLAEHAPDPHDLDCGWDSDTLWYAVREPFPSRTSQAGLVFGKLEHGEALVITSQMPDGGVIFSDGIEQDYLAFNAGAIVRIGLAERRAHLVTSQKSTRQNQRT